MASTPEHVRYAVEDALALVTLARPEARNAYSDEMCAQLVAALRSADDDPAVRCVVLHGDGETFHAGGDVKAMKARSGMFAGDPAELRRRYIDGIQAVPRALAETRVPIVVAIHGAAIGAGLDLCCMADIRIAARGTKLGSTFVRVGLVPGDGGAFFLARTIGFPRALEMMLTGRIVDTDEALRIGLVHDVVEPEALLAAAKQRAAAIASLPAEAVQLTKRAAYRSWNAELTTALELAATYQGIAQNLPAHRDALGG